MTTAWPRGRRCCTRSRRGKRRPTGLVASSWGCLSWLSDSADMYDEGVASPEDAQQADVDVRSQFHGYLVDGGLDLDGADTVETLCGEVVRGECLGSMRVELTFACRSEGSFVEGVGTSLGGLIGGTGVL